MTLLVSRTLPNILITGTPGVGKTCLTNALCDELSMKNLNVNDIVIENNFIDSKDKERDCIIINEDKLVRFIDLKLQKGGWIIDTHVPDCFKIDTIDLVVVLRCNNTILYDRLKERNYKQKKIEENVEAEIMQVILDDCNEYYPRNKIKCCLSNTIEDMEKNLKNIKKWVTTFVKNKNKTTNSKHQNDKNNLNETKSNKWNDDTFFDQNFENEL